MTPTSEAAKFTSSEKLLIHLVDSVKPESSLHEEISSVDNTNEKESEKKVVEQTLQELWTNSRNNIIELRKFGNLLLKETSSVDYTEIEKRTINKKLKEREEFIKQIFRETLDTVIDKTFEKIRQILHPQVISVFLFSKNGCIEKYKTWGKDRENKEIENDWPKNVNIHEKYERGESLSGKAAAGDPYGEPNFSNNLDEYKLAYRDIYEKKLGFLKCGISVPLDSNYRTFGTIEVLNKLDRTSQKPDPNLCYSDEEIFWLTIIGQHLARAISRVRKKQEERVIAEITQMLVDHNQSKYIDSQKVYETIINQLVGELTPYKACILRFLEPDGNLPVYAKSSVEGIKIEEKNEIRKIGEGIVGEVCQDVKHQIVCIDENPEKILSEQWMRDQGLNSIICFPLSIQNQGVGTLSLYTAYKHTFQGSDLDFLTNFSRLLAAYKVGLNERSIEIKKSYPESPENYIEKQMTIFRTHFDELKKNYLNKYVWFEDGEVLDYDDDDITLIKRIYREHPDKESQPLFIEAVTDEALEPEIWDSMPI